VKDPVSRGGERLGARAAMNRRWKAAPDSAAARESKAA